jgi:hypothetical protein
MNQLIGRMACIVLCFASVIAQNNLARLKAWEGKYPTEKKGRVTRRFFSEPEVRTSLTKLLSKEDFDLLTKEYAVETPVMLSGDYLTVKVCKPHMCFEYGAFTINLATATIYVRMADDENSRWFSSKGNQSDLPRNVREYMEDFSKTEIGSR